MSAPVWLRALARVVPARRRDVWLREWTAELVHRRRGGAGATGWMGRLLDAAWCAGAALEDAVGLWLRHRNPAGLLRDLRLAGRSLVRTPGFTVVAVLTLALGIGATTAIFSVVRSVLLRPLPYDAPEELVAVQLPLGHGPGGATLPASEPEFLELRAESDAFAALAGYWLGEVNLQGGGEPIRVPSASVSADFLSTLGVEAAVGRGFGPDEDLPGRGGVVVLTHGLWTRAFAADPGVVGRGVVVNGRSVEVVGVLPASFVFPEAEVDLLRPIAIDPATPGRRSSHYLSMLGRLAPGLDAGAAQARVDALGEQWASAYPDRHGLGPDHPVRLVPLREALVGEARPMLLLLMGAVGVVLLIACANLAALLLVRGERRRHETGVRRALGGSRSDVVAPFLAESALLALLGGGLGVTLAAAGVGFLEALGPELLARTGGVRVDGSVLFFAVLSTLGATLLFGVVPTVLAARKTVGGLLRRGRRGGVGGGPAPLRHALVAGQMGLAVTLVVGSALLTRSLLVLQSVDPGFEPGDAVTVQLTLSSGAYPEPDEVVAFHQALADRLEELPGVVAAGAVRALPFADPLGMETLSPMDRPPDPEGGWNASYQVVTSGWFDAMGIPLLEGRLPDGGAEGEVVIGRAMAQAFWPGEDVRGRRFKMGPPDFPNPELTVVGVVGDVRHDGYTAAPGPQFFVPLATATSIYGGLGTRTTSLVVRSSLPSGTALDLVRGQVRALDPGLPVARALPLESVLGRSVTGERFLAVLVGSFSLLALALGGVGIGGLVAWTVTRRTRELGLRMALGARGGSLVGRVLARAMALAAVGAALGLTVAWWGAGLLDGQLHRVGTRDPVSFAAGPLLLLAVALVAAWLPARRATRIDPVEAMRAE